LSLLSQVQINQTFVPQGPSPIVTDQNFLLPAVPPYATASGAVQAILLDPELGPNTMFIGSTSGGIWETTNGGTTWTPLDPLRCPRSASPRCLLPAWRSTLPIERVRP
jgi:hypothetical protein